MREPLGTSRPGLIIASDWNPVPFPGKIQICPPPTNSTNQRYRTPTMPYPEMMVAPMRQELARIGFQELRDAEQVGQAMDAMDGTVLVAVNSICGCAAGIFRPAVMMALQGDTQPDHKVTVFAGQDLDATAAARRHLMGYPPSSPSIALLKDGDVVFMLERFQIEGRSAPAIAGDLQAAFAEHC